MGGFIRTFINRPPTIHQDHPWNCTRKVAQAEKAVQRRVAEGEQLRARRILELGRVRQSYESWLAGDPRTALERLEAVPVGYRGWEWRHWKLLYAGSTGRELTLHPRHSSLFEFVGKGDRYLFPIDDRTVALRETRTGRVLAQFQADDSLHRVAVDVASERLAVSDFRGGVKAWALASGQLLWQEPGAGSPILVEFSRDGHRLGVVDDLRTSARVYDFESGKLSITSGAVRAVALSPDANTAAIVVDSDGPGPASTLSTSSGGLGSGERADN